MPSSLTRTVFRRLAGGQVLCHSACLRHPRFGRHVRNARQTRDFLGLPMFGERKAAIPQVRLQPGIDKLQEHAKRLRLSARLNPPPMIREALEQYIQSKRQSLFADPGDDRKVELLYKGYMYLRDKEGARLSGKDMKHLLKILSLRQWHGTSQMWPDCPDKSQFAMMLLADLLAGRFFQDGDSAPVSSSDVARTVHTCCVNGNTAMARDMVMSGVIMSRRANSPKTPFDADDEETLPLPEYDVPAAMCKILQGFAREDREQEMLATLNSSLAAKLQLDKDPACNLAMCRFYHEKKKDAAKARLWYDRIGSAEGFNRLLSTKTQSPYVLGMKFSSLMKFCADHGEREWGRQITVDALESLDTQRSHDLLLLWAFLNGKGCDEIDRMISTMEQRGEFRANIHSIHRLIRHAQEQKDAYRAERLFNLAERRGMQPTSTTYSLQVEYRCDSGDVDGALVAYDKMRREAHADGVDEKYKEAAMMNKLIRAMCGTRVHDYESIMNVVADLNDARGRFEAETISTLAILHLSRAEVDDAESLFNNHSVDHSTAERQMMVKDCIEFCEKEETPDEIAWSTYELLRKTFDEMNREQRSRVMDEFFKRGLGYWATQVFEHMRLHTREDTLPDRETYIRCLKGIAKLRDPRSFQSLYNMLKLDTSIEPDTALNNALMEACIECRNADQALSFWTRITASAEGPDVRSIQLALRACQQSLYGHERAVQIHESLARSGFEMRAGYYAWYLAALGAQGRGEDAIGVMEDVWRSKGMAPTEDMIGSLVNVLATAEEQARVLAWANEVCPDVCGRLEGSSMGLDVLGRRKFSGMSEMGTVHVLPTSPERV